MHIPFWMQQNKEKVKEKENLNKSNVYEMLE